MTQTSDTNRQMVLAERPKGEPDDNTLRMETVSVPEPGDGEMLLRTVYLSLDPYMRGRMSDAPSYAAPVEIGGVMTAGTVSRVVKSNLKGFEQGDWVLSQGGWQDYSISKGEGAMNLGKSPDHPSWALGILGMPGFTAWAGLTQIGAPKEGETIVVAAATGPVGATVGQIGKILGCRVVGIAGGPDKCKHAVDDLGFDACVDYKAGGLEDELSAACPDGIDVYFENVGGAVTRAVASRLNEGARVPICGFVSLYNSEEDLASVETPFSVFAALEKAPEHRFFLVGEWHEEWLDASRTLAGWIDSGQLKYRETIAEGIESAPEAFRGLLAGKNFGKQLVRVAR